MDFIKKRLDKLNFSKLFPVFALIYFILVTLCITFPLFFEMSTISSGLVDQLYINWIINWDIYSFTHNIFNIFNANIFYPYKNTLAYSETFITSAIIAFLPVKLFNQPAVAYNFNVIFSFASLGFGIYLLVKYITKDNLASLVSGTLVSFSSYTLSKYMHLQLLSIVWVPLSILFFIRYLDSKKYRYLIICLVFFVVQVYNSFLPGYFIIFSCLTIFIFYFFKRKIRLSKADIFKTFLILLFSFVFVVPIIIPYYAVSKQFSYTRDIRDAIQYANRPEYILYPGDSTRLDKFLLKTFYQYDKGKFTYDGYIGGAFIILIIAAIINRIRKRKADYILFNSFLGIGLFSFILSLGPAFQWGSHVIKNPFIIPLPYALFYYLIPGFNGLRNSARWEMLFLISLSVCIGIFLTKYFENKTSVFKALLTIVICLFIILEFKFPYKYYQIPTKENFPKVYYFVKNLPKNSVISEFPIYNWGTFPDLNSETIREYYSTLSFPKTFNGAAGFDPSPWQNKVTYLILNFPSKQSINLLKQNGVKYIIVHAWEYDLINRKQYLVEDKLVPSGLDVKEMLDKYDNLKLIYKDSIDLLYEIK